MTWGGQAVIPLLDMQTSCVLTFLFLSYHGGWGEFYCRLETVPTEEAYPSQSCPEESVL